MKFKSRDEPIAAGDFKFHYRFKSGRFYAFTAHLLGFGSFVRVLACFVECSRLWRVPACLLGVLLGGFWIEVNFGWTVVARRGRRFRELAIAVCLKSY